MRKRSILTAVVLVATMSSPAWALFCDGGTTGANISGKWSMGGMRQEDQNNFDLMRLRQEGVDATSVERWNGCIRAFVRKPEGGGETMQYFDPHNFRRVQ